MPPGRPPDGRPAERAADTSLPPGLAGAPEEDTGVVRPPVTEAETSFGEPILTGPIDPGRPHGPLTPGESFGPRYHIIRLLGIGGMGAVYQAWDAELGVAVALKVIKPEVMADPAVGPEVALRFKRELLLARQVTHKNVVRIHDLGDINGIKYITMSYVEGADLASILKNEGRLPVARALRIARAVVSGLQAAHEAGVVHRDLKPENIMIDAEDQALIMDFGIARSTARTRETTVRSVPAAMRRQSAAMENQTLVGTVVGTLPYMAPEQARGEPVDQRADIYAFGLILYDTLLGRRRGGKELSAMAELEARCEAPPPPARSLDHAVPAPLDAIITRCMQPDAARRYQTTADLVADLDRLDDHGHQLPFTRRVTRLQFALAAAAVVLLLATTFFGTWWLRPLPEQARPAVSVLIADFENTTGDPVFDGALEQALNLAMEDATFINSYPRTTAMNTVAQLRPGTTRLNEELARLVVQREPDIKYVLAGSIGRDGANGYRVVVRAVDPVPGTTVAEASAAVDGKADVLQGLSSVAATIREALGDAKSETERFTANETFTASSLEAAREYSEAKRLANAGKDEEALAYYDRAIALDPEMGRAHAGKALSARQLGRTQEAEAAWKLALSKLDRMTDRERYRTLGTYYMDVLGNDERGLEQYRQLVERFPFDGAAHNGLANAYFRLLDFESARQSGAALLKIYPKSVLYNYNYALYSMYVGDFKAAETAATDAIAINPDAPPHKAYFALAIAALARGDVAAAEAAYTAARDKAGPRGASLAAIGLADVAMYQGRYADAVTLLTGGIAGDEAAKNVLAAAAKYVALGEAQLALNRPREAIAAAERALKLSQNDATVVSAARVFIAAGREREARALGEKLDGQLRGRSRAYGRLIAGEIALRRGQITDAVDAFRASQQFADNTAFVKGATKGYWLARYALGVAYVQAGADQAAAAFSEFETCVKRHGEAGSVFLDDVPTYRYSVPLWYWMARAQEGLHLRADATANYKRFLALRPAASGDPLAVDAAARLAATP